MFVSVGICICTYNRDEKLRKLIYSILNQKKLDKIKYKIVIVDNYGSSEICNYMEQFDIDYRYAIEPQKGITYARNKCLEIALEDHCDYIAFLDDDEEVSEYWLYELIKSSLKNKCSIVCGPVITLYPNYVAQSIIDSKFFDREILDDGTLINSCGAGNVLIKCELLLKFNIKFDHSYALSGGEDDKFFREFSSRGISICYAPKAIVFEELAVERANLKYILKRSLITAINYSRLEKSNAPFILKLNRFIKGLIHILIGVVFLLISLCKSQGEIIKALVRIYKGVGQIVGVVGVKLDLY